MKMDMTIYCSELMLIFIEYNLAVEADEKEHVDSDLFFEKKDKKR